MAEAQTEATAERQIVNVPITKGKTTLAVAIDDIPADVWSEVILQGLKVLLNRGTSKVTKETYPKADELAAKAVESTFPWVKPEDVPEAFKALQRSRSAPPALPAPKDAPNRLLSVDKAAELLGCSRRTVWELIRQGRLRKVLLGSRSARVPLSEIQHIINGGE